jgi:RNA polymerase sigma factor (sigma-70 family)
MERTLTNAQTTLGPTSSARRRNPATAETLAKDRQLADLMRRAQDGDRIAYSALLHELQPMVRRMIQRRMTAFNGNDHEDVIQDILLSLHTARATYDPARPFLPWLKTIVLNRMIDSMRRRSRRNANEILVDEMPMDIPDDMAGSAGAQIGDADALRKAVSALPQGQRIAIELLKFRELSLKEASAQTGMSVSGLKASVHRAMKSLRSSLGAPRFS